VEAIASARSDSRRIVQTILAATAIATLVAVSWFATPPAPPAEVAAVNDSLLSAVYDPPTRPVEIHLARGDGQIFATHAQDPLLRRPDLVRGGRAEQAYRLQRPLYGWLGWAASGGQAGLAPWALIVLTIGSVALLAGIVASFLAAGGRDPLWALLVVVMPGVLTDLTWVGPEALGVALLVIGLRAWQGPVRNLWVAVPAFAVAGLARETMLIVPAVLAVTELVRTRARGRDGLWLAGAALPFVGWLLVVRWRIGVWPEGSVEGRLSALPFGGLLEVAGRWTPGDVLAAIVVFLPAAVVLARRGDAMWKALVLAHLALAAALGAPVWERHVDFDRVLLPLAVLSLLALGPRLAAVDVGERVGSVTVSG
jgi:hypothetical protein